MNQSFSSAPADIVRDYWLNWSQRNKARCLTYMHPDATYALYVPQDVLPFGGITSGRSAISDRLQTILDVFDALQFDGHVVRTTDEVVHGRVEYCFRHKVTGESIDGSMRQIIVVRDGLIVTWEEYTDVERVRAFMRLVAYSAAS